MRPICTLTISGLVLTALLQAMIVYYSESVALLADTIHNAGAQAGPQLPAR